MGMKTELKIGYTSNLKNHNNFAYLIPAISFDHKLFSSDKLILATKIKGHFNYGDSYEFYQAATIGGNENGLRGYRNQRFTGKNSFYQSTDLRLLLSKIKTSFVPLNIGVYGGFDYGKVWGEQNLTINPFSSKKWNNSYGGGVFFNAANMLGANIAAFNSDDGLRIAISLGFKF